MSVVLPAPRNPDNTVTGRDDAMSIPNHLLRYNISKVEELSSPSRGVRCFRYGSDYIRNCLTRVRGCPKSVPARRFTPDLRLEN